MRSVQQLSDLCDVGPSVLDWVARPNSFDRACLDVLPCVRRHAQGKSERTTRLNRRYLVV